MRILTLLFVLIVITANGQTKIFRTEKLDSADFKDFIANKKVIVIGEMHGTTEVPLFVLQLIQQLKKNQKELTIGLEISTSYQKDLDEFLKTGEFEILLKLKEFTYPDGRSSVAMGELIKGLRDVKGLNVVCFDIENGLVANVSRDSLMGINLSKSYKGGQMVILTGNLHANMQEGYWKPNFKSATFHFNRMNNFGDQLVSLNTYFGSGTIWNCMNDGCKERDAGTIDNLRKYGQSYLMFFDKLFNGYNGLVYFDKVTASKPLVP